MRVVEPQFDKLVEWFVEMRERARQEGIELSGLAPEEIADFLAGDWSSIFSKRS